MIEMKTFVSNCEEVRVAKRVHTILGGVRSVITALKEGEEVQGKMNEKMRK